MPEMLTLFIIYVHILSAFYWIGGNLLFFSFGLSMRHIFKDPSLIPGFRALGKTFRIGSWISVFLLIITGFVLLFKRWGGFNTDMIIKVSLFLFLLPLKILHDFFIAPKAAKEEPPGFYFKLTLFIARLNLFILLLILYFSIKFVR